MEVLPIRLYSQQHEDGQQQQQQQVGKRFSTWISGVKKSASVQGNQFGGRLRAS